MAASVGPHAPIHLSSITEVVLELTEPCRLCTATSTTLSTCLKGAYRQEERNAPACIFIYTPLAYQCLEDMFFLSNVSRFQNPSVSSLAALHTSMLRLLSTDFIPATSSSSSTFACSCAFRRAVLTGISPTQTTYTRYLLRS